MILSKQTRSDVIDQLNEKRSENAFLIRTIEMDNADEIKTYGSSVAVREKNSGFYLFSIGASGDFSELVKTLDKKMFTFYLSNGDFVEEILADFPKVKMQRYIQYVLESKSYRNDTSVINHSIRVEKIGTDWTDFILSLYKSDEFGYKDYIDYCIRKYPAFGALDESGRRVGYVLIHQDGEIGSMVITPEARGKSVGRTLMQYITPEYARLASIGCGFVLPENSCSKKMMEASCFVAAEKKIIWAYI